MNPQETKTLDENLFLKEAHIHALANEKGREILVIQPTPKVTQTVLTVLYSPGWELQRVVTRRTVVEKMSSTDPPILIHLNMASTHFSGYAAAPKTGAPSVEPNLSLRQAGPVAERARWAGGKTANDRLVLE